MPNIDKNKKPTGKAAAQQQREPPSLAAAGGGVSPPPTEIGKRQESTADQNNRRITDTTTTTSKPKKGTTITPKGLRWSNGPNDRPGAVSVTGASNIPVSTGVSNVAVSSRSNSPKGSRGNSGPNTDQPGAVLVTSVSNVAVTGVSNNNVVVSRERTRSNSPKGGLGWSSSPNGAVAVTGDSNNNNVIVSSGTTTRRSNSRSNSPKGLRGKSGPNGGAVSVTGVSNNNNVVVSSGRTTTRSNSPKGLRGNSGPNTDRPGAVTDPTIVVAPSIASTTTAATATATANEKELGRNSGLNPHPGSAPTTDDSEYQIDRRPDYQSSPAPELVDDEAIVAELVDEDAALAAQNEIDRLRKELEGIRQQQLRLSETIVQAEPVIQSSPFSSHPDFATTDNKKVLSHNKNSTRESILTYATTQAKKIQASSLASLHGRDHERNILHNCLDQMTEQKQLVMISGYSGCGKSALASSLKPAIQELQGLYVSGNFDQYQRDQPYFGIISVGKDICKAIVNLKSSQSRKRSFQGIRDQLSAALTPQDFQIINEVVPGFCYIMDVSLRRPSDVLAAQEDAQEAKNRLHFVFRIFFRIVCSYFAPLVIVIDDLQWSDVASLELMQAILTDTQNHNFMLIGLYRSNEVICGEKEDARLESHILTTVLRDLEEKAEDSDLRITELEIGNLGLGAVQSVVMDLLSLDTDSTRVRGLASVCHVRTSGNVFFLIAFLSMLEDEGLLTYDCQRSQYTWDLGRINSETVATSNVVDLMKSRLAKLPKETGHVLSVAACLGATFELSILNAVLQDQDLASISFTNGTDTVEELLFDAVREGFIERLQKKKSYRWIHDKIQEAAFSLIPSDEVSDFKFRIGDILRQRVYLEEHIFEVVNLLNEPTTYPLDSTLKMELARLNLQATKKALSGSAFSSAAKFASKGINHLVDDHWKTHYKMSLDLYTFAAVSHEAIGKHEEMKLFCDEVMKLDCSLLDKVPMYSVLASYLTGSGQHVEATELLLDALGLLGCRYPRSRLGRLCAIWALGAPLLRKMRVTTEKLMLLPRMECPKLLAILKMNDKLMDSTFKSDRDLCGLAVIRSVELTYKHGISPYSPVAAAAASNLITSSAIVTSGVLTDLKGGGKWGDHAMELQSKMDSQHVASRIKFVTAFGAYSWVRPLPDVCRMLLEAYSEGLHSGDTETAASASFFYIELCFLQGRPLKQIHADCFTYGKQMVELKREQPLNGTKLIWQTIENLIGHSANPTRLQGNIIPDFDEIFVSNQHNRMMVTIVTSLQLRLHATFGSCAEGADLFRAHGYDFLEVMPHDPSTMPTVFCGGLCCFATARNSTGKKHRWAKQLAMKARATIENWIKQENPNVRHYKALMDAERDALRKRNKSAEKNYHHAIAIATRFGFVHDAALAHERFSDFMASCLSDEDGAAFHLKEARKLYDEWGATGKVEALQKEKKSMIHD